MFQLIATTLTISALLWATALKSEAHAALTYGPTNQPVSTMTYGAPVVAGASLLPDGVEISSEGR
jgi:hypothetical protein